ncbi:MAG: thioredoxin [Chloroflexi bacterium RBG_19FT_COMBO_56_12]|nr:MAG: thioredoxin [Chloroflexi bacterium RBG_19FT_COMBO_56_12]
MADIPQLSEVNFDSEVIQSALPVIVDFTAAWCSPCKMLDPVVKQIADELKGRVKVVKLDVDDNPNLTMQYGVMGVPTLMLFVNGSPAQRMTGYQPKDRIIAKFASSI